ncbi:MAG: NADH-quinone oxidoreductase subunit NuoN [Alphaproteobacteria bacterium]|nr:NADH-quinone oxidoreductase subunit NuoN [Alphaproteobacteria bacterium]
MTITHDLAVLVPELMLAVGSMAALLLGAWRGNGSTGGISIGMALLMAVAAVLVVIGPETGAFHGAFVMDGFARFADVIILMCGAFVLLMAQSFFTVEKHVRFEMPVLIALSTLGMMLMVSASNFIALYLGLELHSLALYVLAAFNRDNARSSEAGLKYFVLGALSSGLLLYGISLIYGFTGTMDFAAITGIVKASGIGVGLVFGLVFLIAGLAFKLSAVPFHMWAPDVYEGAPTPITAFIATASKVAALVTTIRAILVPFPDAMHQWQQVIIAVSVLSMALGAVAAIGQENIKRLMAYSSIGHMGYALLGLVAGTVSGVKAMLFYLAFYAVTNIGVFVCIQAMRRDGVAVEKISDLAGLARTRPRLAFAFSALMLSLAGIPPLAGIFPKIYVFLSVVQAHQYVLAAFGFIATCVGAYYYLRVAKVIYFDEPAKPFDKDAGWGMAGILTFATAFTVLFVFMPWPLINQAALAAQALFR